MSNSSHAVKFKLLPLTLAISSALLTACSGGSFSSPSHITAGVDPDAPSKNQQRDQQSSDQKTTFIFAQPTSGSAMPIPKIDLSKEMEKNLDIANLKLINAKTFKELFEIFKQKHTDVRESEKNGYQFANAGYFFSGDLYKKSETESDDAGRRYKKGDGYLYYYGENPTIGVIKGTAKYTGHWDFVTNAKKRRDININIGDQEPIGGGNFYGMLDDFGDKAGATSFSEKVDDAALTEAQKVRERHRAEFEADFNSKKLTGKLFNKVKALKSDQDNELQRYSIDADIIGNRFIGSAIATNKENKVNDKFNLFSKDATGRLEGGFYGDKAQELAGKFLTDDNSVFGVFAAKTSDEKQPTVDREHHSLYVDMTNDSDANPRNTSSIIDFDLLGDVNHITFNSTLITLLPQNGKSVEQKIELATGQKATITNFGTADGMINLGNISKEKSKNPYPAQLAKQLAEKAKQELDKKIEDAKKKVEEAKEQAKVSLQDKIQEIATRMVDVAEENSEKKELKTALQAVLEEFNISGEVSEEEILELLAGEEDEELEMVDSDSSDSMDSEGDSDDTIDINLDSLIEKLTEMLAGNYDFSEKNPANWEIDEETLILATADGLLRKHGVETVKKAKQALQQKLDSSLEELKTQFQDLLDLFAKEDEEGEEEDDDENAEDNKEELSEELKEQINKLFAEAYSEKGEATKYKEKLKAILDKVEEQEDDESATAELIEAIATLFKKGDKLDPNRKENLESYLASQGTAVASIKDYSNQAVSVAKIELQKAIYQAKQELKELLEEQQDNAEEEQMEEEQEEEEEQESESLQTQITKIVEKVSKYSSSKKEEIKKKIEEAFSSSGGRKKRSADSSMAEKLKKLETEIGKLLDGINQESDILAYLLENTPHPDLTIDDSLSGFYLVGEITPKDEIPQSGEAKYTGKWSAKIDGWSNNVNNSQAEFDVKFGEKKLTGTLKEASISSNAVFKVEASINENQFTGTAKLETSANLKLDKDTTTTDTTITQKDFGYNNLQGAFYGPYAKHLAGGFTFEGETNNYRATTNGSTDTQYSAKRTVLGGGVFYGTASDEDVKKLMEQNKKK